MPSKNMRFRPRCIAQLLFLSALAALAGCDNPPPPAASLAPASPLPEAATQSTPPAVPTSTDSVQDILRQPGSQVGVQPWSRELCDGFSAEARRRQQGGPRAQLLDESHGQMQLVVTGTVVDVLPIEPGVQNPRRCVRVIPDWVGPSPRGMHIRGMNCMFEVNNAQAQALTRKQRVKIQGSARFFDSNLRSDDLITRAIGVQLEDCKLIGL